MKIATVYEREGIWYFVPSSKTVNGLWVDTLPIRSTHQNSSLNQKGQLLITSLENSQINATVLSSSLDSCAQLIKEAAVKSWASFMSKAKCISVELEDGVIKAIPQKKLKHPKGAMESISEQSIEISSGALVEQIGFVLEHAMQRSK